MKTERSTKTENSHNNITPAAPAASVPSVPSPAPLQLSQPLQPSKHSKPPAPLPPSSVDAARNLLPPAVRERKFRARSFASRLTRIQFSTLSAWLLSQDSIETVRKKVAAPPPEGFGMQVCPTTLRRIQSLLKNASPICWVDDAMDTACDLLDSDGTDVAPLREALSLMLYSRAIYAAREQAHPADLDRLLSVITKIEKLKSRSAASRQNSRRPAATRHIVELSVAPASAKTVQLTATPIRDAEDPAEAPEAEPKSSSAENRTTDLS